MQKKILIIGGTGFIGYHLAARCKKLNWEVVSVSTKEPVKNRRLKKVRYKICDISIKKNLAKIAKKKYDYVVNLGGYVDHINKIRTYKAHYLGAQNLFKVFKNKELKSFIQIGSSAEYGTAKTPHKENVTGNPGGVYGKSKLLASKFMVNCYKKYNFPVTILRFYQLYGPKQNTNRFIPILIDACLCRKKFVTSSGNQSRDFLYIDDLVDFVKKAIQKQKTSYEIYNCGSGKPISIKDLCKLVIELSNKNIKLKFNKSKPTIPFNLYLNCNKAKKELNWAPKTDINFGIRKTIKWWENNISGS